MSECAVALSITSIWIMSEGIRLLRPSQEATHNTQMSMHAHTHIDLYIEINAHNHTFSPNRL